MPDLTLTAIPAVSTPCLSPPPPCACPVYGPGGAYLPVEDPPGSGNVFCALALESPGARPPVPVPTLSEGALVALGLALVLAALWRIR